jgi:hypothetical protein
LGLLRINIKFHRKRNPLLKNGFYYYDQAVAGCITAARRMVRLTPRQYNAATACLLCWVPARWMGRFLFSMRGSGCINRSFFDRHEAGSNRICLKKYQE